MIDKKYIGVFVCSSGYAARRSAAVARQVLLLVTHRLSNLLYLPLPYVPGVCPIHCSRIKVKQEFPPSVFLKKEEEEFIREFNRTCHHKLRRFMRQGIERTTSIEEKIGVQVSASPYIHSGNDHAGILAISIVSHREYSITSN